MADRESGGLHAQVLTHARCRRPLAGTRWAARLLVVVLAMPTLVARQAHAVAASGPGQVFAWGGNTDGQLGIGSTQPSTTPVLPALPAGTVVTAVAAGLGNGHSLALTSTGQVLAWGDNSYGQLGIAGGSGLATTPTPVNLPPGTVVTAVSAGVNYSLALTSTGQVLAWGDNSYGQLGIANTGPTGGTGHTGTPMLVRLPPGSRAVAVAAGGYHSLALTSTGQILAWGSNAYGQLGNGSPIDGPNADGIQPDAAPGFVQLPQGTTAVAVAAGAEHSLAITSAGRVLAWGINNFRQLGYDANALFAGGTPVSRTPAYAELPQGVTITAVAGGEGHSLARTSAGGLLGWGSDYYGQLADAGFSASLDPRLIPNLPPVASVAAGFRGSLVATTDGRLLSWGDNSSGQLGYSTPADNLGLVRSAAPAAVPLAAGTMVTGGSMSDGHTLAVTGAPTPPTYTGDASAVYFSQLTLHGTVTLDGGAGICEAGPLRTHVAEKKVGQGLCSEVAEALSALGLGTTVPGLPATVAAEAVDTGNASGSSAHSAMMGLRLLAPDGTLLLDAEGLASTASVSCTSRPTSSSSIASLTVAGAAVATKPVGSRIILNPTGRNAVTLYGNPIAINPMGGRIPMATVTLNYSEYNPTTNTQRASPLAIDFPARGPLASLIVGRVFLSHVSAGVQGCAR